MNDTITAPREMPAGEVQVGMWVLRFSRYEQVRAVARGGGEYVTFWIIDSLDGRERTCSYQPAWKLMVRVSE